MKYALRLVLCALAICIFPAAGSKKIDIGVRFHTEGNSNDTNVFSSSVQVGYPPHPAYVEQVPRITERDVRAIYPFPAADGSWGCSFYLDGTGRLHLEVLSTERRGSWLVTFVRTKLGIHHVGDILIDQRISDGIIFIPHGFTELEIAMLSKQFKVLNDVAKAKK